MRSDCNKKKKKKVHISGMQGELVSSYREPVVNDSHTVNVCLLDM